MTAAHCDDDDSETVPPPGRVITGLFGCCTGTAVVSLLWLITGNPWLVAGVTTAVMVLYMLENLAFFEEILALEGAIRVKTRKVKALKEALADLTEMHAQVMGDQFRRDILSKRLKNRRGSFKLLRKSGVSTPE